jgi:hypothetical protein
MDPRIVREIVARTGLDPRVVRHVIAPGEKHPNGKKCGSSRHVVRLVRRAQQEIIAEAQHGAR